VRVTRELDIDLRSADGVKIGRAVVDEDERQIVRRAAQKVGDRLAPGRLVPPTSVQASGQEERPVNGADLVFEQRDPGLREERVPIPAAESFVIAKDAEDAVGGPEPAELRGKDLGGRPPGHPRR
jgi:hypothetical protein